MANATSVAVPPANSVGEACSSPGCGVSSSGDVAASRRRLDEHSADHLTPVETRLRDKLFANYDKSIWPWTDMGGPVTVSQSLAVQKIAEVDLLQGQMSLLVWWRLTWVDPRLTWDVNEYNVSSIYSQVEYESELIEIWQPEITLWNEVVRSSDTMHNHQMAIKPDGTVYWSRNGILTAACNIKGMRGFPYTTMSCLWEFGDWTRGPTRVLFQGTEDGGVSIGGSDTSLANATTDTYTLKRVDVQPHLYPAYPCCPEDSYWPVLWYTFEFSHAEALYTVKVVLSQALLTFIGFTTFWLNPACGERIGLAITIPLAAAVYDLLVFQSLPNSNQLTFISAFGLLSFLVSMLVALVTALVIQLHYFEDASYFGSAGSNFRVAFNQYQEQRDWIRLLQYLDSRMREHQKRTFKEGAWQKIVSPAARVRRMVARQGPGGAAELQRKSSDGGLHRAASSNERPQPARPSKRAVWSTSSWTAGSTRPAVIGPPPSPPRNAAPVPPPAPPCEKAQRPAHEAGAAPAATAAGAPPLPRAERLAKAAAERWMAKAGVGRFRAPSNGQRAGFVAVDVAGGGGEARREGREAAAADGGLSPREDGKSGKSGLPSAKIGLSDGSGDFASVVVAESKSAGLFSRWGRSATWGRSPSFKFDEEVGGVVDDVLVTSSRAQLRALLQDILASNKANMRPLQRAVQRSLKRFDIEHLVARLQNVLQGSAPEGGARRGDMDDWEYSANTGPDPRSFRDNVAPEYNRRWRLLAKMVDYACRYIFIIGYFLATLVICIVTLT